MKRNRLEFNTSNDNIRITSMLIMEAKSVLDRNQLPQWELTVKWEWTPASNTWGERVWVYKDRSPQVMNKGMYTVKVERGNIKNKKGGDYWDGSQDWMYNWKVLEFDAVNNTEPVHSQPQPQPQVQPQVQQQAPVIQRPSAGTVDEKQMMIMRQSTLNYASILMAPVVKEYNSDDLIRVTTEMASKLLQYVITGEIPVSDTEPPIQEAF
tara:strand:+ start:5694 stop:6320 length:627 start_codon:yes stop_codon:yes gene_type:complete